MNSCFPPATYKKALLTALAFTSAAEAEIKMPRLFGDHMVLQQQARLPVWGWATPGEKVTVTFGSQTLTTTAKPDRTWRVDLEPIPPTNQGQRLTIAGANTVTLSDVLVGDVFLASGQSNMELGIQQADGAQEAIAKADDPELRLFFVPWATALEPQSDLTSDVHNALDGKWVVCTPDTMKANWAWHGFSAIGYFSARELRQKTGHPIGMIASYKGGTPAQSWTSVDALRKDPQFDNYIEDHDKLLAGFAAAQAAVPAKEAAFRADLQKWNQEVGKDFDAATAAWSKLAEEAKKEGKAPPPAPQPRRPKPQAPSSPDGGYNPAGNLFNGMVAPLIPFGIRGVIWYQGESNANTLLDALQYHDLFSTLITDWRTRWNQPGAEHDFPFLFVELAGYESNRASPIDGVWPWLRESQRKTLSLPNTAIASATDIGDPTFIHPGDKADVGHRLALAARKIAYGEKDLLASGPVYSSMNIDGPRIRISFTNIGSGLKMAPPPWLPHGAVPPPPDKLRGFLTAGADQNFVEADAVLDGQTVVVSSPQVSAPVAVRYAWSDYSDANLYNSDNLPAEPFRTDTFQPGPIHNLAVKPIPGGGAWQGRFTSTLAKTKGHPVDLLFDGDSITDWFQTTGKAVWAKYYGHRSVANLAIAGDQTSQVLYRLQHGEADGLNPKLVVLLIGTNNTIRDSPVQIAQGIEACVNEYKTRCPNAHILLLSVFPRRTLHDPFRPAVEAVNAELAKIDFGDRVTRLDLGHVFLEPDGTTINLNLMPGRLHPNEAGYEAWAKAMEPTISQYVPAAPTP